MRKTWSDERLDDMSRRMEEGFRRIDAELREVNSRFDSIDARFDALQRTLLQLGGGLIAALIGLIGLIATQL